MTEEAPEAGDTALMVGEMSRIHVPCTSKHELEDVDVG
jgi:hypothetical protein